MCISNFGTASRQKAVPISTIPTDRLVVKADPATTTASHSNKDGSSKKSHPHIIVQHNYHDHSHDPKTWYQIEHPARGGVSTPFPLKLHEMLDATQEDGLENIVSWQPHGRCFVVHQPKEFVKLLPKYFKLSKLASFQRQLNLYGFQRITRGKDRGGYYHELFLKNKVFMAHNIQRIKVKGTGVRARSNPDQEPNFWSMPWVSDEEDENDTETSKLFNTTTNTPLPATSAKQVSSLQEVLSQNPLLKEHEAVGDENNDMDDEDAPPLGEDEDVVTSFGKSFHFLKEVNSSLEEPTTSSSAPVIKELEALQRDADQFFADFEFDDSMLSGSNLEDDEIFGDILESMIL